MAVRFRSHLRLGRRRLALLGVISVVLAAATLVAGPAGARGLRGPSRPGFRPPVASSYLALGDSLAFGYSEAKFDSLYPDENPADYETGYVNDFADVLKLFNPGLQIVNDGCPGETTESFIHGPCAYVDPELHAAPPLRRRARLLAALRRARLPGGAPGERQPDHDRHRRQRRAGADRDHLQTGSGLHRRGGARGVREDRRQPRPDPRRAARRGAARADHRAWSLQPLRGNDRRR